MFEQLMNSFIQIDDNCNNNTYLVFQFSSVKEGGSLSHGLSQL